jgi:uncharacterized membrane protein
MRPSAQTHVEEAIDSIAELERRAQESMSPHQRWIERVTRRVGRPRVVYFILAFVSTWIGLNLVLEATGHTPFDAPPFPLLDGLLTLVGLLLVVLVLTTENRTAQIDLQRSRLDLQINLLTERRTAKLIDMIDALRRDLPQIPTHYDDPEVRALRMRTDPHAVAQAIEERTPPDPAEE